MSSTFSSSFRAVATAKELKKEFCCDCQQSTNFLLIKRSNGTVFSFGFFATKFFFLSQTVPDFYQSQHTDARHEVRWFLSSFADFYVPRTCRLNNKGNDERCASDSSFQTWGKGVAKSYRSSPHLSFKQWWTFHHRFKFHLPLGQRGTLHNDTSTQEKINVLLCFSSQTSLKGFLLDRFLVEYVTFV